MAYRDRALSRSDPYGLPPPNKGVPFPWWVRTITAAVLIALFAACCWALGVLGGNLLIWPVLAAMIVIAGLLLVCIDVPAGQKNP